MKQTTKEGGVNEPALEAKLKTTRWSCVRGIAFGKSNWISKKVMKKHEWRETTEEGATRLVTATRHGGKWKLRSRLKSEPDWTDFPAIPLDDLETLHEIMEKKYQRNRVPHEHIQEIETLIAAAQPRK